MLQTHVELMKEIIAVQKLCCLENKFKLKDENWKIIKLQISKDTCTCLILLMDQSTGLFAYTKLNT